MAKMVTQRGYPITSSRPNLEPQAPVRSNAADTSRDAERIVSRNANQLSNPYGVVQTPAPANQNFRKAQTAGLPSSRTYGSAKGGYNVTEVGCDNTSLSADEMSAIGYGENATKSNNPIISGFPTRKGRR